MRIVELVCDGRQFEIFDLLCRIVPHCASLRVMTEAVPRHDCAFSTCSHLQEQVDSDTP